MSTPKKASPAETKLRRKLIAEINKLPLEMLRVVDKAMPRRPSAAFLKFTNFTLAGMASQIVNPIPSKNFPDPTYCLNPPPARPSPRKI